MYMSSMVCVCVLFFYIVTTCISFCEGEIKPQERSLTSDDVKLQGNVVYEYRKPVQCQLNTAYDMVTPHAT